MRAQTSLVASSYGQQVIALLERQCLEQRRALVQQMKAFGQRLAGRHVNLGALVLEGREDLEDRA